MLERQPTRTRVSCVLLAALAGCAVGPNYKQPGIALDGSFINAGSAQANSSVPGADIAAFWRGFRDPVLTALVERAVAVNFDVRIAQARLREARAGLVGARATLLPEIDVSGSASRSLSPEYLFPGTTQGQRTTNVLESGFVANWELDLFGRNRRATESAAAQLDASAAGLHAARTSVVAEVARNYLQLRGFQQRYGVAQRSLDNQVKALRLTELRLDAGRGTLLDVSRARALHDSTSALLPALQAQIDASTYRLATLTAQSPRDVLLMLGEAKGLPSLPITDLAAMPLGTPEQLLRRRPDLVAAERRLASATADIGVATADLFPRVTLTGLLGFATDHGSSFGDRDSRQASLGAGLSWPVLDFGRVRSRIDLRKAQADEALATYEQAVATALQETESALSEFTRSAQQARLLASSSSNAEQATRLSRARFDAGSVDLLVVLDAERQALSAEDALVQSEVSQATALVSVYRSLGGGWDADAVAVAILR